MTRRNHLVQLPLLPIVLLILAFGACGGDDRSAPAVQGGSSSDVALATDQALRLNLGGEPSTLDPSKASISGELSVIEQLFRGPFRFDEKLNLVPDMAKDVPTSANGGISADGLTYTFTLRDGLRWSDGKPITANDVVFAIKRSVDPRTAGDYADFYRELKGGEKLGALKPGDPAIDAAIAELGVSAPSEATVKLTLAKPNAAFVNYLGMWMTYPLREDVIKEKGTGWIEAGNLVSSGPFVLKEWAHKDHITLVPNPNYYGPKVTLQSVKLAMIEDPNQAFNAYRAGELDQAVIPAPLIQLTKADPDVAKQVVTVDRMSTSRVGLLNTKAPFDDKKVRQAFAYAIDRKALVDVALKGAGKPATSFIPPGIAGYDANAEPKFDAAKAKQLLADAGFAQGKGLPQLTFTFTNAGTNPAVATFLKEQWKAVLNVDVDLDPVDAKTFAEKFRAGQTWFAIAGFGADFPDAGSFLTTNLRTNAGNNKSHYSNKEFDALLDKAMTETDRSKAAEIYKQAQKIMQDDSPDLFLYYSQVSVLRRPAVKGLLDSAMDHAILGDRSLERAKIVK